MKYIQNRTNWCWVAACKVAGEQYKKNFVDAWQSAIARNADFLLVLKVLFVYLCLSSLYID